MRYLLLFLSAIDAAFAVVAYQAGAIWFGLWMSALASWALVVAMKLGDKENDETEAS